jgi:hypothetical protein
MTWIARMIAGHGIAFKILTFYSYPNEKDHPFPDGLRFPRKQLLLL